MIKQHCKSIIAGIIVAMVCLDSPCFALGTAPASQNAVAKRSIIPVLARKVMRIAKSDYDHRLLKANNASCILLSADRYLVTPDVAGDDIRLMRAIVYADVKAIVQIIRQRDGHRYDQIRDLVIKNFPPIDTDLSEDRYIGDTLARAFEWLCLLEKRRQMIDRSEIPEDVRPFIEEIEPLILNNAQYLFTSDFWNPRVRSARIRRAVKSGMVFYEPVPASITTKAAAPAMQRELYRSVAERFRDKRRQEGIILSDPHVEIIEGILRRIAPGMIDPSPDPDQVIVQAMRDSGIRRILEIGCGNCALLAALAPDARAAGAEIIGIDHDPKPAPGAIPNILDATKTQVIAGDAVGLDDREGFDIVMASGVMSLWGAFTDLQLQHLAKTDPRTKQTVLMDARAWNASIINASDLVEAGARLLSDNPKAALYTNSLGSMLMLNKSFISRFVDIAEWDASRKIDVDGPRNDMDQAVWEKRWVPLWNQGASFAVLTKKGAAQETASAADPMAMVQDETGRRDNLIEDLFYAQLNEDTTFEVAYDVSRISQEQRDIVEAYIDLLAKRSKNPDNIRRRPFSSSPGSKKPLISVKYTGRGFAGEGHINVEERDLQKDLVRITPMINIALAASTIPDCKTAEEIDQHQKIIRYIEHQYEAITGRQLVLPESPEDLVALLRNIPLPRSAPINAAVLDEYNRMAKEALASA